MRYKLHADAMLFSKFLIIHIPDNEGIKVPELSEKTGVNDQTLYGYVGDKKKDPSVHNIYAIAKYFSVSIKWLITGEDEIAKEDLKKLAELFLDEEGNFRNNFVESLERFLRKNKKPIE